MLLRISVDSTQITKHMKDLIESVESDVIAVGVVEGLATYRRACDLGQNIGMPS